MGGRWWPNGQLEYNCLAPACIILYLEDHEIWYLEILVSFFQEVLQPATLSHAILVLAHEIVNHLHFLVHLNILPQRRRTEQHVKLLHTSVSAVFLEVVLLETVERSVFE